MLTQLINTLLKSNDRSCGLFSGGSGNLLFLSYLHDVTKSKEYLTKITHNLQDIFENLTNDNYHYSFSVGIAGLGWVYEDLVERNIINADPNEVLSDVDELVYEWMIQEQKNNNYDYLHGAMGGGMYFLKRLRTNPNLRVNIEEHLKLLLSQMLVNSEENTSFWTLKPNNIYTFEETYNLGLSHGIPSILVYLSKCFSKGIGVDILKPIIQNTTNFILKYAQKPQNNSEYYFPTSVNLNGMANGSSRLAWCYGDIGVCCSLWQANQILNDESLDTQILEILLHNCQIHNLKNARVVDAGLCHGASGIAHIFKRFYHRYKHPSLKESADYWYEVTLNMAIVNDGLAIYKQWTTDGWEYSESFLEGSAGITKALLYREYENEPYWDEILLIS
jgi:lantibiotic biosynthesis protein